MRAWRVHDWGEPESMRLEETATPEPAAGQVRIRNAAAALNFFDILQVQGKYQVKPPFPFTPGAEVAGVIDAVGEGVATFRVGDRVIGMPHGNGFAEYSVSRTSSVFRMPEGMTFEQAAAMPIVYQTSYFAFTHRTKLRAGETLLVHAGASGVGSAVIQLARESGATVFATAGSEAKLDLCRRLGATAAFHRELEDFPSAVLQATGDAGVHLVIDFVGAPYWAGNLRALRTGGRLVLVGFLGGSSGELDLGLIMRKSLIVRGTTLRARPRAEKARLCDAAAPFVLPRLADGRLQPAVDPQAFTLAEVAAAHAYVAGNRSAGKVVLEV